MTPLFFHIAKSSLWLALHIFKSKSTMFYLSLSDNMSCFFMADSLSYTSAISVALAVVFVVITAGIAIVKLIQGQIPMPKLFPEVPDLASVWELFTAVPVLVTAYVCHYNGTS
jgi:hypothetical protein